MNELEDLPPGWKKGYKIRSANPSKKDPVRIIQFLILNEKLHFISFTQWNSDSSYYVDPQIELLIKAICWSVLLQFYTDPVSGYVFRSKKDVMRYLETGDINQCACRPKTLCGKDQDLTSGETEVTVSLHFLVLWCLLFSFCCFYLTGIKMCKKKGS